MSLMWQEEAINFLAGQRKYRVLWWGFGPTLLESLCKKKGFNAKKLLEDKFSEGIKEQCITLLEAFGEEKLYWWWPWSGKLKDAQIDKKQCQRAGEYGNYSWFWKIVLGLFTSVLIHCRVLQWNSLVTNYYGGCMFKKGSFEGRNQARNRSQEVPTTSTNISDNLNKGPDLMTLGDVLKLFGLPKLLQELDVSLEEVRRHIKDEKEHEQRVKDADKEIRNLSLKYHPDRVQNRGGSDEEVAQAKEMQTALGTTRTVLNSLTKAFLKDLDVDYKYGFYAKMEISLLGNEDEVNKLNFGILNKLARVSEIKQGKIIANINSFLKAGQCGIESFINDELDNFKRNRDDALLYLSMCVKGYKKLVKEFNEVKKECGKVCEKDKALKGIYSSICNMLIESEMQLDMLQELDEFATDSLQKKFQPPRVYEDADEYFVLPFIEYVSVLLMCSKMCVNVEKKKNKEKKSWFSFLLEENSSQETKENSEINFEQERVLYGYAHCLASYFNGNNEYGKKVRDILEITGNKEISHEKVRNRFFEIIKIIKNNLAHKFKPDSYIEGGVGKYIMEEYIKWTKIMDDVLKRAEKSIADTDTYIESSRIENKKLREDCDRVIRGNAKLEEECRRSTEESRKTRKELQNFTQELFNYIGYSRIAQNEEASTSQQQPYAQGTNDQQQESAIQASNAKFDQQQKPNAQAANDSNVLPMSRSRSSSLSSSGSSNNDQSGPSSRLSKVQPIPHSQSLSSLYYNDSDIKIDSRSQCR